MEIGKPLSTSLRHLFEFIEAYATIHGDAPTQTEMADCLSLSSAAVWQQVGALARLGYINTKPRTRRGITIAGLGRRIISRRAEEMKHGRDRVSRSCSMERSQVAHLPERSNIPLKALSLFTGAMGLDLGLEDAGFSIMGCVESSRHAAATIRANRPAIPVIEEDIRRLSARDILRRVGIEAGEIGAVVGSPPCQPYSAYGKQRGMDDERGPLLFEFVRLVSEISPAAFLMENVQGLGFMRLSGSKKNGSLLETLLDSFNDAGYRVDVLMLDSANYGVPQFRRRLFLVGNKLGLACAFPKPTHGADGKAGRKPYMTLGKALANLTGDADPAILDFSARKKRVLAMIPPGSNWRSLPVKTQKKSMGKSYDLGGGRTAYWRRLSMNQPCPTIMTLPNHASTSLCHPDETRALTVGECAAIQGFPAQWRFSGGIVENYRQIGNAVPVGLGRVMGHVLRKMLRGLRRSDETQNARYDLLPQHRTRPPPAASHK